jgi:hypothetical protein
MRSLKGEKRSRCESLFQTAFEPALVDLTIYDRIYSNSIVSLTLRSSHTAHSVFSYLAVVSRISSVPSSIVDRRETAAEAFHASFVASEHGLASELADLVLLSRSLCFDRLRPIQIPFYTPKYTCYLSFTVVKMSTEAPISSMVSSDTPFSP